MAHIVAYPAVLDDRENEPGQFTVTFPDVPGAISQGDSLAEALANAEEALGLMLFDETALPVASPLAQVQAENPGTIVSYVTSDLDKAADETHPPMVKKNTRIPADVAAAAEARGINFSATLTMALREKLKEN